VDIEKTELSPGLTSFRTDRGVVQVEQSLENRYQIYKKLLGNESMHGSELPALSAQQKEIARKFNIPEEEYARNVLAGSYGLEKTRKKANDLGQAVQGAIRPLDAGYRVTAVIRDVNRLGWVVRIETPRGDVNVLLSKELAEGLLDSGSESEKEQLRIRLLTSLEQSKPAP